LWRDPPADPAPESRRDALHIAIATAYDCHVFADLERRLHRNAEIQRAARLVDETRILNVPAICIPEELDGRRGMNLKDEIVEEVRAAISYERGSTYNLAEMYKDLKAKEQTRCRNIATLPS